MYEEFTKANPNPQSRINTFLATISPDTRGLTARPWEDGKAYTFEEIDALLRNFYELEKFPVGKTTILSYCEYLASKGIVKKLEVEKGEIAFQKTDAGIDLIDPLIDIGTYIVSKLLKMGAPYCSLWKILGGASKPLKSSCGGGFAKYKVLGLLAENRESKFSCIEIYEILREREEVSIPYALISHALFSLCEVGVVDCFYLPVSRRRNQKVVKANKITEALWEELRRLEKAAYALDSWDEEFRERHEYYRTHQDEWKGALKIQLERYNMERTHLGVKGGEETRKLIQGILLSSPKGMSAHNIYKEARRRSTRGITLNSIYRQLRNLEEMGKITKRGKVYYLCNESPSEKVEVEEVQDKTQPYQKMWEEFLEYCKTSKSDTVVLLNPSNLYGGIILSLAETKNGLTVKDISKKLQKMHIPPPPPQKLWRELRRLEGIEIVEENEAMAKKKRYRLTDEGRKVATELKRNVELIRSN
jgi:Fe2+ or Zn2+ uptake regulation protein